MSALVSLAALLAPFCSILVATRRYARRSIRDYETYRTALTEFQSWRRNNPLVVVPGKVRSAEYELERNMRQWDAERAAGLVVLDTAMMARTSCRRLVRLARRASLLP